MWLSNTATTMMMYPIAASVIHVIKENHKGNARLDNLAVAIMLAIAYASNFGGIATIVGTPPNAIVFASGHIKFNQMVKAGFVMNIVAVILITLFCWYLVPLLMGL